MNVRPLHPALYLLGLGHRLSPIGLGRVVTCGDYVGDGPSLGWVTERLLPVWVAHDDDYKLADRTYSFEGAIFSARPVADAFAISAVIGRGVPSLARYRLAWRLADPMLRLAWRYRWGGWQDLPPWLWWSCLAAWSVLPLSGWAGLGWLIWRIV